MSVSTACPKCKASMEDGFLLDRGHYNSEQLVRWIKGKAETGFWGLKTWGKESLPVSTYRCPSCGYLESYAVSEAKK